MVYIEPANNTFSVSIRLTDKKTGNPLPNKNITITFKTLEQILGGKYSRTITKTLTTDNNGIIDTTIAYSYEFDNSFGVQASFNGDDEYKSLTVKLTAQ